VNQDTSSVAGNLVGARHLIAMFGCQRVGSNYLLALMKGFENASAYGEMLHSGGPFPLTGTGGGDDELRLDVVMWILEQRSSKLSEGEKNLLRKWVQDKTYIEISKYLGSYSRQHPVDIAKYIRNCAPRPIMSFKVFPEHISEENIPDLIEEADSVMLLARNPVETFISYQKLIRTQMPERHDTSNMKIHFEVNEFLIYLNELKGYYSKALNIARAFDRPVCLINYEHLHQRETADEKAAYLKETVSATIGVDLGKFTFDSIPESLHFNKQDNARLEDRVSNPQDLPAGPSLLDFGAVLN